MVAMLPSCRLVASDLTDITLLPWIAQATPGARLEYHRGFLGVDVTPVMSHLSDVDRGRLADVAAVALQAFEQGLVHLVQERLDPDHFAYIAVARPRPRNAAAVLSALLASAQAHRPDAEAA